MGDRCGARCPVLVAAAMVKKRRLQPPDQTKGGCQSVATKLIKHRRRHSVP